MNPDLDTLIATAEGQAVRTLAALDKAEASASKYATAAQLGVIFRRSARQILAWKRAGTITAAVDTGRNILLDADTVREQLAKRAKARQAAKR